MADAAAAQQFGETLSRALEELESRWPRGTLGPETATGIRHEREEALMRGADGRDVLVLATPGTQSTVLVEADLRQRSAPLGRFVRIHPSRDRAELLEAIGRLGKHLAAVSVTGFGDESPEIARRLAQLGASRICSVGEMQAPPLGWHHDGRLLIAPLARLADIEEDLHLA